MVGGRVVLGDWGGFCFLCVIVGGGVGGCLYGVVGFGWWDRLVCCWFGGVVFYSLVWEGWGLWDGMLVYVMAGGFLIVGVCSLGLCGCGFLWWGFW